MLYTSQPSEYEALEVQIRDISLALQNPTNDILKNYKEQKSDLLIKTRKTLMKSLKKYKKEIKESSMSKVSKIKVIEGVEKQMNILKVTKKSKLETTNSLFRRLVPTAQTIEEVYTGDEAMILQVCKELQCDRNERIFTSSEVKELMEHVDSDIPIKITMMDFNNKTMEDALCEITTQY